jgi:salicylate hydroxylase
MARGIVMGKPGPPVPTGQQVFRVTLPTRKLEGVPELKDLITIPRNNHWIGPHGTILSYLLQGIDEPLVNFVFTCDVLLPDGVNQRITPDNKAVRAAFKGWDPRIDRMLEYVDEVLEWRLYTHEELPSWVHHSNKLCLIGDAAHAMTPYLAQGAAMGIEDSAILGGLLEEFPSAADLPQTLKMYEQLRIKRSAKVASASIESRYFTQMPDGEKQRDRDEYLLSHPGIAKGHRNIRSQKEFLDELFGYDAYKELAKAVAEKKKEKEAATGGMEKGAVAHVSEVSLAA